MGSSPQETQHREDAKIGTFKSILLYTFVMGGSVLLCLIAAILCLMFLSFGDEMWPILFKLKIGPGP